MSVYAPVTSVPGTPCICVRVARACTHADRVVRTFTMGVGHKGIYSHEGTVVLLQSCMYCVEGPHSRPFSM